MAFVDNKYLKAYKAIIEKARLRGSGTATHHIVPKSFGGGNEPENLVRLTDREHFVCHRLLVKCTSGQLKSKMAYALWRMCNNGLGLATSRTYDSARLNFAATHSARLKGRNVTWAHKMKGKRPHVNQTGVANNNHQGTYVTPWGGFSSLSSAKKSAPYKIDIATLSAYCRHKNDVVHVGRATKEFMRGKTPRECGFAFIPKD